MDDGRPMFRQIMEKIEGDIVSGVYGADDPVISTTQIARVYAVNHATAVKAIGKLSDSGVLYKKRGIGMYVAQGAKETIAKKRRESFFDNTISALLAEAKTLGISTEELIRTIKTKGETNE